MPDSYPVRPTIGDSRLSERRRVGHGAESEATEPPAETPAYDPADHTIDDIKAHVEEHPDQVALIREAELARGDKARQRLIDWLTDREG